MKLFLKIGLLSLVSCSSLTTYTEEQLKQQSESIKAQAEKKLNNKTKNLILVKDIISNLKYRPLLFSAFPDEDNTKSYNKVSFLHLKFYSEKEFHIKKESKIKLYDVFIYFKRPIEFNDVLKLSKKYNWKWTNEVELFFGNIEVENIYIPDLG